MHYIYNKYLFIYIFQYYKSADIKYSLCNFFKETNRYENTRAFSLWERNFIGNILCRCNYLSFL